jgi:hypothetical protein
MLRSRVTRLAPLVAAHWAMNEPAGATTMGAMIMVDDSGHSNNGILQDVAANAGFYTFNGSTSRVVVPDNPDGSLDPGTADFSYSVRVRTTTVPDDVVGDYDLLRKGLGSTKARALCQAQGTKGAAKLVGSANLADGAWHTITCEKKPSALNMYVDGVLTATKPNTIGSIANAAALTIGAKDIGGDWFRGDMDDATVAIG